jgi:hypothetical protein
LDKINAIDFLGYTMGYAIADLVKDTTIVYTVHQYSVSLPWNKIYISEDAYQGGYNPAYYTQRKLTETGRIGIEIHELWHQVQYKQAFLSAVSRLGVIERIQDLLHHSPYNKGNPQLPGVLDAIHVLADIPTLEGQAQFVGQWAADVYQHRFVCQVNRERLIKEGLIIRRSGFDSPAASEVLAEEHVKS